MFGIDDAITAGANLITTIVNKVVPDADIEARGKVTSALQMMQNEYNTILSQVEVNKIEASSSSLFIAGARPAAMWVGVLSLFYSSIGLSVLNFICDISGLPRFPEISTTTLDTILMGLLGLGTARTVEKVHGVDTKRIK